MNILVLLGLALGCHCLTDLEKKVIDALQQASQNIQERDQYVKEDTTSVQSQKASDDSKLEQLRGDLLQEATKILIAEYGVEILPQLAGIDVDTLMSSVSARKKRQAPPPRTSPARPPPRTSPPRPSSPPPPSAPAMGSSPPRPASPAMGTSPARPNQSPPPGTSPAPPNTAGPVPSGAPPSATSSRPSGAACKTDSTDCQDTFNTNYRSITGVCNNRNNAAYGQAINPTRRLLGTASYADYVNAVRNTSSNGVSALPSPRVISNQLSQEGSTLAYDYMTNHFMMQFGQMIAHDLVLTPNSVGPSGEALDCNTCDSSNSTDNCAPIPIPSNDPYFRPNSCMRFTRALNAQKSLGVRQPVNQNSHFLDMSFVYGSAECTAGSVRTFSSGMLKTYDGTGYPLPPQFTGDRICRSTNPYYCFTTGDGRNTLHPGLIPMHTLYIREHNRIAQAIAAAKPSLSDEDLYQNARKINIAQFQHHVYNEYLPKLLGDSIMQEFGLQPLAIGGGYFNGYDDSLSTSPLTYEFTGAAFRFGHSQAREDFTRTNSNNVTTGSSLETADYFFYADAQYDSAAGGTEAILNGLIKSPAMAVDRYFTDAIRNHVFDIRDLRASGVDLVATNIMRGRDLGLYPYNAYRETVGLKKATSFNDLLSEMDSSSVAALQGVYATVDDIDLYLGLLMEKPLQGSMLGRTGSYIIAETFKNLKNGDRFFYESYVAETNGLTADQLNAIRATTLARILCESTDNIPEINKSMFDLNSATTDCSKLAKLDLTPFTAVL